ncbi:MAG: outer membrane beta-barrel protein [Burkholderiales bacterium]
MKKTAILIAALVGVLLTFQAQAQEPGQSFFGAGFGAVNTDGASPYTNTQDEDTASGYKIYAGTMFDNHFGMELGYYDLGRYNVNFGGAKLAESKASAITVAGVLATPLGGGYYFHAKAGLAFTQFEITCRPLYCGTGGPPALANTTKRGVSGVLGLGLGARLWREIELRIDYDHFGAVHHQLSNFGYKNPYDILSVSMQFNF